MLDTNMVSYIVKGNSLTARDRLDALHPGDAACVSSITEAEIRYGLAKLQLSSQRIAATERFLAHTLILPFGSHEAQTYGQVRARQEAAGKTLNSLDMLIAAHAIATGAILVTHDKAFHHIPGLIAIEDWATDLQ
jgi:tRNA(fMet)-specific endonuclease VapC